MDELKILLTNYGLHEKEIAVYLAIFERGRLSPARIAALTGIKRPTVYVIGQELEKKGFIIIDDTGKTLQFLAKPLDRLQEAIQKERDDVAIREVALKKIVGALEEVPRSQNYSVPKTRFIEGEQNVLEYLYERTPEWLSSMTRTHTTTWWGYQDHTFVESDAYRKWILWYWKQVPKNSDLKLLSNDSEIEKEMKSEKLERRQIRFGGADMAFTSTQWIVGEYLIMIVTRDKPHYVVETRDAVQAKNMAMLFKNIWEKFPN